MRKRSSLNVETLHDLLSLLRMSSRSEQSSVDFFIACFIAVIFQIIGEENAISPTSINFFASDRIGKSFHVINYRSNLKDLTGVVFIM